MRQPGQPFRCGCGATFSACGVLLAGLAVVVLSGCNGPTSELRLVSYQDPYFPETVQVRLVDCKYRFDAGRDLLVVGRSELPDEDSEEAARAEYLHVRMFWKPVPGRSFAESSQTDALIRYVVVTEGGTAVYAGTGFAFPKKRLGGMDIALESGRLQLESTDGDTPDVLGETRLTGTLRARHDPNAQAGLTREMELAISD